MRSSAYRKFSFIQPYVPLYLSGVMAVNKTVMSDLLM